ncbi:vWA domain-containing protein [Pseudoflavonifractor phocaeensis]|uniref:vWA domain-containing protein n=1 Tax=Pseudoflavonifractor phocaeensis TaxID=1870988 RepID=UPI001F378DEB|nr:VWA containing CoxE family protein [Pseudoflavonifractor phocaeensis]MCF2662349.1 VWA containing CoxE family protein [Pseudoflavonifractor phocaeensis]
MFEDFLYLLRRNGLKISLTEWMSLMEALDKGLHGSSFTGFYHLCRCLLVKSEADFDLFDRSFLEYFQDVPFQQELPQELMNWLEHPNGPMGEYDELQAELNQSLSHTEIEVMFRERKKEQREAHNCGTHWVGTHGMSVFGNMGMSPDGIRVGGPSEHHRAFRVAGERRFRDFRKDAVLDTRQFQVALRKLRQFSGLVDLPPTEFDVDNTIQDTAENAGNLKVRYKRPRENTVKVLLLMDSGGSMEYYGTLCTSLFHAVSKSGHFKSLDIYYFHNCVYTRLYKDPIIDPHQAVPTEWVLSNHSGDWKIIFVGDAQMDPSELEGRIYGQAADRPQSGLEWLKLFREQYRNIIWLNPGDRPEWGEEWSYSYDTIADLFPMYPLTVEGLEDGMKKLLTR